MAIFKESSQERVEIFKKLIELRLEVERGGGFWGRMGYLTWGRKVQPLIYFDKDSDSKFGSTMKFLDSPLGLTSHDSLGFSMIETLDEALKKLSSTIKLDEKLREKHDAEGGEETMTDHKKVFVVHGRDGKLRVDFFNFLRSLGLKPIEWTEATRLTGKSCPYVGEILDKAFNEAQAIVVLLSPDDEVRLSPSLCGHDEDDIETKTQLQARPNVLFEAGMAMGKNPDRTLLIEVGKPKPFSDVWGRHVIRLTNRAEKRKEVAQRLEAAGCSASTSGDDWMSIGDFDIKRKIEGNAIQEDLTVPLQKDLADADIIGLLYDWWPKGFEAAQQGVTVRFDELDKKLGMSSGSSYKHIRSVATEMQFKEVSFGSAIAIFKYSEDPLDYYISPFRKDPWG